MKIRKITSLTATLSFLLLILNSVVLYIAPHGRIARWADWRLWGLTKTEWTNQHVIIGILFLFSIFLHIYYNWQTIMSYLKNKARQLKVFTRDFNIALVLTVVCTVGAYIEVPPFNWVLDFSESIKNSAEESDGKLPYGRAELSTLKTFTAKTGLDFAQSVELLKKAGINFESEKQTLQEVAKLNKISPQQVYIAMKPEAVADRAKTLPDTPEAGMGKRPLTDICREYNLNISTILQGLADNNIKAAPSMNFKEIAEQNNISTTDIYAVIKRTAKDLTTSPQTSDGRAVISGEANNTAAPTGLGKLTLTEAIEKYKLDPAKALEKLAAKGIKAKPGDKMRKIAEESDITPSDLYRIIE